MFLLLGIGGKWMSKQFAGVLGTLAMGVTTIIAYSIALTYFFGTTQGQIVDGVRQQLQVLDFTWLQFTDNLVIKLGEVYERQSEIRNRVVSELQPIIEKTALWEVNHHVMALRLP